MFFGIEICSLRRLLQAILLLDKPVIHVAKQFLFCFVTLQNCLLSPSKHFRISSDISRPTLVLLLGQEWDVLSNPRMPCLLTDLSVLSTDAFVSDLSRLSVRHVFLHCPHKSTLVQNSSCCLYLLWYFLGRSLVSCYTLYLFGEMKLSLLFSLSTTKQTALFHQLHA